MSAINRFKEKKVTFTVPLYLVALVLVGIVTGLFFFQQVFPMPQGGTGLDSKSSRIELLKVAGVCPLNDPLEADICIQSKAIESVDLNLCMIISSEGTRKNCIAIVKNIKKFCQKISDSNERDFCISEISQWTGSLQDLPKDCTKLPKGYKTDFCVYNKAMKTKDAELCRKIIFKDEIRLMCVAILKGDKKLCQALPGLGGSWGNISLREHCTSAIDKTLKEQKK